MTPAALSAPPNLALLPDEFAVLLRHCDLDQARRVAVELAALVAAQRFCFDGVERSVTASIGIAPAGVPGVSLAAADRAMYAAKALGGNRARLAH